MNVNTCICSLAHPLTRSLTRTGGEKDNRGQKKQVDTEERVLVQLRPIILLDRFKEIHRNRARRTHGRLPRHSVVLPIGTVLGWSEQTAPTPRDYGTEHQEQEVRPMFW